MDTADGNPLRSRTPVIQQDSEVFCADDAIVVEIDVSRFGEAPTVEEEREIARLHEAVEIEITAREFADIGNAVEVDVRAPCSQFTRIDDVVEVAIEREALCDFISIRHVVVVAIGSAFIRNAVAVDID